MRYAIGLTLCLPLLAQLAASQTQVVYQAEAPTNTITAPAAVALCSTCSGQADVQGLGGTKNGALQFNNISAPANGAYQISVTYANSSSGSLSVNVMVNGTNVGAVSLARTGSQSSFASISGSVSLKAGSTNSISFSPKSGSANTASIDKLTVSVPSTVTPTPAPSGTTVLLSSFGAAGLGNNDTTVFQAAIKSTASAKQVLEIPPAASGLYHIDPLSLPSNTSLLLDSGTVIQATSGYGAESPMILMYGTSNITITGTKGLSVFQMLKSEYTSGEDRHCLALEGATNVTISGIECNGSGGDGVYIGEGPQGYSLNVSVLNSSFDNNRRQGMSIISGKNISVTNCSFTNSNGNDPDSGIDIEPNRNTDVLQNISIQNSVAAGNAGSGVTVGIRNLDTSSQAISIVMNGISSANNKQSGFAVSAQRAAGIYGPGGSILIENSTSTNDAGYGVVSSFYDAPEALATFQNITITNANSSRTTTDGSAAAVRRGGGDSNLMGSTKLSGLSIIDQKGYLKHYFAVEDSSGAGMSNIHVDAFGTLSGLPSGNPNGMLNGAPVSTVAIN